MLQSFIAKISFREFLNEHKPIIFYVLFLCVGFLKRVFFCKKNTLTVKSVVGKNKQLIGHHIIFFFIHKYNVFFYKCS